MSVVWFPTFSFQPGFFFFVCVTSWLSVLWKSTISPYMLSRYFFLALYVEFFKPFLSLLQFFSYDSLLKLFHFLLSCLLFIISYIMHGFFVFYWLSEPNNSQYPIQIYGYCSTAIPHFHFHFRLPGFSSVFEHITSPNPIFDFPFGTLWHSSIY